MTVRLRRFGLIFDPQQATHAMAKENTAELQALGGDIEREVAVRTPNVMGLLRDSVFAEVRGASELFPGRLVAGIGETHASYVELGTRPHWPDVKALRIWAKRKFQLRTEAEVNRVAFLVGRTIAGRSPKGKPGGTKAQRMFERGVSAVDAQMGRTVRRWERSIIRMMREGGEVRRGT